jgi:hypothetical protein
VNFHSASSNLCFFGLQILYRTVSVDSYMPNVRHLYHLRLLKTVIKTKNYIKTVPLARPSLRVVQWSTALLSVV